MECGDVSEAAGIADEATCGGNRRARASDAQALCARGKEGKAPCEAEGFRRLALERTPRGEVN